MIRPLTFLSLVAAAGAGLHLYSVKHEVAQLEKVLRETVKQTEVARERTAVLRAEWALLNEPERLRAAATRNLPLEVMQTNQFVRAAELERRLPAAVAFAGAPSLFAPAPSQRPGASNNVAVASAIPASMAVPDASAAPHLAQAPAAEEPGLIASVSVEPLPIPPPAPPPAPVQLAAARTAPAPAPSERAAPAVERSAPAPERPARVAAPAQPQVAALRSPVPRAVAEREPAPRLAEAPRPVPRRVAPQAVESQIAEREVDRGINLAAPPQAPALLRTSLQMRQVAPAAQPPAPRAPEMPVVSGSMLGGASRPLLAPPVPVARASAATLDSVR
ncbi:hypothetical protein J8J14_12440 [Roseomonas sp. SSH11]|uniref:Cell division protein FtsL n=1 Tax=Pararoseomonas baculiformis TaxID=2820812 RepID=A0ABS4AFD0_9PROT|nr:hypothetical protein [Pararoseomonas baculiformis]MBP0445586.1 hypothetical protein [Pararoseomonas baculiformis]